MQQDESQSNLKTCKWGTKRGNSDIIETDIDSVMQIQGNYAWQGKAEELNEENHKLYCNNRVDLFTDLPTSKPLKEPIANSIKELELLPLFTS